MFTFRATLRDAPVRDLIKATQRATGDMVPAWKAAAVIYYQHVSKVFRSEGHPDKWKPLALSTLRRRRKGKNKRNPTARILQDRGILRGSATTSNAPGSYLLIAPKRMIIGSTLIYAGAQNYGHGHIPARPFFTITPELKDRMHSTMLRFIARRAGIRT